MCQNHYGIDALSPVNDRGVMTDEAPGFEGLFYEDANKAVTEALDEGRCTFETCHSLRTLIRMIGGRKSRSSTELRHNGSLPFEAFRPELLEAIRNTKFTPSWGETRLYNMVRDRGDWCISRQRVWGVPIPVFYAENGEPIITDETIEHVSKLFREHGSNVWFERDAKELLPEGFSMKAARTANSQKRRISWTSGLIPARRTKAY